MEDYRRWVPKRLDETGALVEPEPLDAYPMPVRERLDGAVENGFFVPPHIVTFADRLTLRFTFSLFEVLDEDGEFYDFDLETYSFGLRRPGGQWIWRYDKHQRVHYGFPTRAHLHEGPGEVPRPWHEVDLDDVLHIIETERDGGVYASFI